MKTGEFKFGQLITIDNVVYRCSKAEFPHSCEECDIESDANHGFLNKEWIRKRICIRCQYLDKNFKKIKK